MRDRPRTLGGRDGAPDWCKHMPTVLVCSPRLSRGGCSRRRGDARLLDATRNYAFVAALVREVPTHLAGSSALRLPFARCESCASAPSARARRELLPLSLSYARQLDVTRVTREWSSC
jgi:hypothetical protein